jgi:hypothetical protein
MISNISVVTFTINLHNSNMLIKSGAFSLLFIEETSHLYFKEIWQEKNLVCSSILLSIFKRKTATKAHQQYALTLSVRAMARVCTQLSAGPCVSNGQVGAGTPPPPPPRSYSAHLPYPHSCLA